MKKKDLVVLSMLRNNSRITLTDISRKTNIPISTLYDKVKQFEGGLISRYSVLLDFARLGFVVRSQLVFAVDRSQKDEFACFMGKHHNVNNFCRINNGFDFMAEVVCRDINELETFLETINQKFKIKERKSFYIIEDLKREGFFSDKDFVEMME